MMNFAHTDSLKKLLCVNCQNLLSHFPIYFNPNGPTCGRCPTGENSIRNEAYENLAQFQKFPCCHKENGCLENLFPKDIPQHERLCSYRKYSCLTLDMNCRWRGLSQDLLTHFEEEHPLFLLSEGNFEIDFVNSHKENYLLPYGENLFMVNRTTDSKTGTFCCNVTYIGSNKVVEEYSYKIILESGNKSKVHELTKKLNCPIEIDSKIIRSILNDPLSIVARIEVFREEILINNCENKDEDSDLDYELLRELECLVCMEYMVPPIHQCVTGHSICMKCKEKVKECPTCKKEFGNTQNYALAQIISHITYPCKYERCSYKAKAKNIKVHEATCSFGPFKCPLQEYVGCESLIIFDEMYDHILNNHYENLLEMETVSYPFNHDDENEDEDCYIVRYGTKLFKLHYMFNGDNLFWAMQLIGPPEESSKYKFELDVADNTGNNGRAYFKAPCGPLTERCDAFLEDSPHIFWAYDQIKQLIGSELCYRVRIMPSKMDSY
nr:uncharacterized protein LOC111504271 [Leptinotarsa decemlineata]XP_023014554.1 uncharacterized protein LOC111504271 [Leptinotarsa decemlineata]